MVVGLPYVRKARGIGHVPRLLPAIDDRRDKLSITLNQREAVSPFIHSDFSAYTVAPSASNPYRQAAKIPGIVQ